MKIENPKGSTPITQDDLKYLIPQLTLWRELNQYEEANILLAKEWALTSRTIKKELLSISTFSILSKKMFDRTWKWAGAFRKANTNIGVDPHQIQVELKKLIDDVKYWIEDGAMSSDEIAIRFHHRLVWIHPFPNGNGRFSRLAADLLIEQLDREKFSWGAADLGKDLDMREVYIAALRKADGNFNRIEDLLSFARS